MSDSTRTNLVLQMRCAKCGRILRFTYDKPATIRDEVDNEMFVPSFGNRIPGADKVELSAFIHPCEACYTEAVTPIRLLKRAIERTNEFEKREETK